MRKENNPNYYAKLVDGKIVYVKRKKTSLFDVVNYTVLGLFALICILPIVYLLLLSFASKADYLQANTLVFPFHFNVENYKVTLYQDNIFRAFGISVLVTVLSVGYSIVLTSLGAYSFTKKDVPGLKFIFYMIVFTMFFGGGLVPFYLTVKDTTGVNNLASIIIPFGVNTFNMIVLRNFFKQVPDSIIESCRLDGASEFRILFTFVLPLSKAGVATIMLYYLVAKWNDWYWPAIFLSDAPELAPMALKIRQGLNNERGEGLGGGWDTSRVFPQGSNAAMIIIALIPIMAIYPFLQKYFTKGVMVGAIKS
ncbi:MAG: carbohydrate ABC transporter permease [Clostridia bacterium]|nr:carbohydrate ABC transporter permease [Clostridia bacterium]